MFGETVATLARRLFGGACFLCRGAAKEGFLCADCDADLPRLRDARCPRCALASPGGALCGRCLVQSPHFDSTVAALDYRFPADVLVHALKFRGELALAPFLGKVLIAAVPREEQIEFIVPVPLSARRLRGRGCNQSLEIARPVARAFGVRLAPELCERTRDTPVQAALPAAERARNVAGAFRCARALDGATIAVVDDVMTTGATLDALAGALKAAGAGRVVNWVVARTALPD
jgi:ComF family protein